VFVVEDGEIEGEKVRRVVSRRLGRRRKGLNSSDDADLPDEIPASFTVRPSDEDSVVLIEESCVMGGTSDVDDLVEEGFAKFEETFGDEEEVGGALEVMVRGGRLPGLVSKESVLENPLNDFDRELCEEKKEKDQFPDLASSDSRLKSEGERT